MALIAITISIGGILLGMAFALDDKKLKEIAKTELYIAVINGVILGTLIVAFSTNGMVSIALTGITNNVSQGYYCPSQMEYNSALCFAYNYVAGTSQINIHGSPYPTIFDSTIGLLVPLSGLYSTLSIINSMSFNLGVASFGMSGAMKPLLTGVGYAIDALVVALLGVEVQGFLLMFISAAAMPILMPIAIALRCFYFTRRLGSALLAITIGLFAVLPMTYVLDASLVSSYSTSFTTAGINATASNASGLQSGLLGQVSSYERGVTSPTNALSASSNLISGFINAVSGFFQWLSNLVAIIVVQAFLMPAFSIMLTVISIRELARILGSEVHLGKFNML